MAADRSNPVSTNGCERKVLQDARLPAQAIDTGQARLNTCIRARGSSATKSRYKQGIVWEVEVTGVSDRRGSASGRDAVP